MTEEKLRIAVIVGSTRPNRNGIKVAKWVYEHLEKNSPENVEFELVDIESFNLPLLDEPIPAMQGKYSKEHTKKWSAKISEFDGYIFVTPEYNHGMPGALKNAIDFLYKEWNNKAAAFVSYGVAGGVRSTEQFRQVMGNLQVADVSAQVAFNLFEDFENFSIFKPRDIHEKSLNALMNQLISWAKAMKTVREKLIRE